MRRIRRHKSESDPNKFVADSPADSPGPAVPGVRVMRRRTASVTPIPADQPVCSRQQVVHLGPQLHPGHRQRDNTTVMLAGEVADERPNNNRSKPSVVRPSAGIVDLNAQYTLHLRVCGGLPQAAAGSSRPALSKVAWRQSLGFRRPARSRCSRCCRDSGG